MQLYKKEVANLRRLLYDVYSTTFILRRNLKVVRVQILRQHFQKDLFKVIDCVEIYLSEFDDKLMKFFEFINKHEYENNATV